PVGDEVHVAALGPDLAGGGSASKAVLAPVLVAVLEGHQGVDAIAASEHAVPACHGLVVAILTGVVGGDEILSEAFEVGGRIEGKYLLPDGTEAAGGQDVAGKGIADVRAEAVRARGSVDAGLAGVGGERIVDLDVPVGEMLAAAQAEGRGVRDHGKRHALAESLEAEEDEIAVLAQRSAERAAPLVGDVLPARRAHLVVLRVVGVEHGVAME